MKMSMRISLAMSLLWVGLVAFLADPNQASDYWCAGLAVIWIIWLLFKGKIDEKYP
jgi:hypothetical protein